METYWKSLAMPVPGGSSAKLLSPRPPQHGRALGSAQTSPSTQTLAQASGHSLTHSSVTGSYIYVTVQVTRDLHPVVFPEWRLPDESYELGVADVTLSQFKALASRLGRGGPAPDPSSPPSLWARWIASSMITMQELLRVRPTKPTFPSKRCCLFSHTASLLFNLRLPCRPHSLFPQHSAFAWRSRARPSASASATRCETSSTSTTRPTPCYAPFTTPRRSRGRWAAARSCLRPSPRTCAQRCTGNRQTVRHPFSPSAAQ